MGTAQSTQEGYFLPSLQALLKERGSRVSRKTLQGFFEVVRDLCPWFPKEGSVDLEHWHHVGQEIKNQIFARGTAAVPEGTMNLWSQIRDLLDPKHSIELLSLKSQSVGEGEDFLMCSLSPSQGRDCMMASVPSLPSLEELFNKSHISESPPSAVTLPAQY